MHRLSFSCLSRIVAATMLLCALAGCQKKPSIVKTEEGKRLTAHAWETNYITHREVVFNTDGSLKVTVTDGNGETQKVDGKWSIDGTTLTTTIYKQFENDELIDKESVVTYTYSTFMTDAIIDDGDQSIKEAREKYEQGTQWYVSEKYLYFAGSVWIPKKDKS